jgi:hypothetical protein
MNEYGQTPCVPHFTYNHVFIAQNVIIWQSGFWYKQVPM